MRVHEVGELRDGDGTTVTGVLLVGSKNEVSSAGSLLYELVELVPEAAPTGQCDEDIDAQLVLKWHRSLEDALGRLSEVHGYPWRAEPSLRGSAWVVRDTLGAIVAAGLDSRVAELLADLPKTLEELDQLLDPFRPVEAP